MIIVLVGLPASGKTTLGKFLSKELNIPYLEDVSTMEYLPCTCIVDNPYFCLEAARNKLQRTNRKFIFWYFENDPEQCILNDRKRQRKQKSQSLIKYLSKQYLPSEIHFKCFRS